MLTLSTAKMLSFAEGKNKTKQEPLSQDAARVPVLRQSSVM